MQQLASDLDRLAGTALEAVSAAGPWSGPSGVVGVEIDVPDAGRQARAVAFAPGSIALTTATPDAPDAVVRLPLQAALDLATGAADGALLHLAGVLEVEGDEDLLLQLGLVLRSAAGKPLVDPVALDPLAVSAAIAGASTAHLTAVMGGGFRALVLEEVFRRLPGFLIAEKATGARVAIGFEIGGRRDGGADRYVVRVRDGACVVTPGPGAGSEAGPDVDATLVLAGHQFLRLVLGHLNPVRAVVSGEVQVRGHLLKALAFNALMHTPGR